MWPFIGSLLALVWVDLLLSGDNAIVIALVCRTLPARQQLAALMFGALVAVVMRVALTFLASTLLGVPFLRIIGGTLLFWIAIKLILQSDEDEDTSAKAAITIAGAAILIGLADASMSLDNVVAIAAIAAGNALLFSLGLIISIPGVIFGAAIVRSILSRAPWLGAIGAMFLGYLAAQIAAEDAVMPVVVHEFSPLFGVACASAVGVIGWAVRRTRSEYVAQTSQRHVS